MESEEYNEFILPEIITPKIRINDQYIDESSINRSIPEKLQASQLGNRIGDDSIGYTQILRVKTGGIQIDMKNSKLSRYPFDVTTINVEVEF